MCVYSRRERGRGVNQGLPCKDFDSLLSYAEIFDPFLGKNHWPVNKILTWLLSDDALQKS